MTDTDLVGGLFDALYDADLVRVLPYLIDRLARGDAEAAVPLAQRNIDLADRPSEGLNLSVDCAEEAPFNDDERIAAALAADPILAHYALVRRTSARTARVWAVPALPEIENAPVASAIPTLLTTGGYDPVTPARFAEVTAEPLAARYIYTFPGQGHGAVWTNWVDDCAAQRSRSSSCATRPTPPDASCIDAISPTDFLTDEDIQPTLGDLPARQRSRAGSRPAADRDRGVDPPGLHRRRWCTRRSTVSPGSAGAAATPREASSSSRPRRPA